jgi:DNA-directed RNA polymerase specialized sigma24 family protein
MTKKSWTDAELVAAMQTWGPPRDAAFEYLFLHVGWRRLVSQLVRRRGTRQDVEDVYCEAMLRLESNLRNGQFHGDGTLEAYFMRIARNVWYGILKKQNRYNDIATDATLLLDGQPDHAWEQVLDLLDDPDIEACIRAYLDTFGKYCNDIRRLDDLGYNQTEIAQQLGMTGGAAQVKKEKYRCEQRKKQHQATHPDWLERFKKLLNR